MKLYALLIITFYNLCLLNSQTITTASCGKCGKQVSSRSNRGDRCPHCGVLWSDERQNNYKYSTKTAQKTNQPKLLKSLKTEKIRLNSQKKKSTKKVFDKINEVEQTPKLREENIIEPRISQFETEQWILSKLREITPKDNNYYNCYYNNDSYLKEVSYAINNSNLVISYIRYTKIYRYTGLEIKEYNSITYFPLGDFKEIGICGGYFIEFLSNSMNVITIENNTDKSAKTGFVSTIKFNSDANIKTRLNKAFSNLKQFYSSKSNKETF